MKALLMAPMGSVHRRFNGCNIAALQDLGYDVHLLANFDNGEGPEQRNQEFAAQCQEQGIATHSLPYHRHELKGNLILVRPTRELLSREHYDLVHAHTETGGLLLRLAGKRDGAPRVYTAHGMSFYRGSGLKSQLAYRPIERWICAGMDANIAINAEEYAVLRNWNANTARLVHGTGIDLVRMQVRTKTREQVRIELGVPQEASVVLSVGELDDNKNHAVVVEALANTDAYYVICGVGPNDQKLHQLAGRLGMSDRLVLAGFRNDIPDVVGASDVFAFPSKHEGLPVALMEAIAGGLPVVCSQIRGNVDLVEQGSSGLLVQPDDVEGWRKALQTLLADARLREQYTRKSMSIVEQYAQAAVRQELHELYGQLLQSRSKVAA